MTPPTDATAARQAELLAAAAQVFLRYGYKKTTMDEVARAAGLSRPGLYLHFPAKELVFRAAVAHLLDRALSEARSALSDAARPLDDRIVEAFVAVHGHTIGTGVTAQHMAELIDSTNELASETAVEHERAFREELIRALKTADRGRAARDIAPSDLADLLTVISVGLKHRTASLAEYRKRLRDAVRLLGATGRD